MTAADIQARFDANKETYRIGEKRKVSYALVEVDKVRERVEVPQADVQAFYAQNKAAVPRPRAACAPATSCSRPRARTRRP